MRRVRECEEVRVIESLHEVKENTFLCLLVRQRHGDDKKERKKGAHISGADPSPGLIDYAFAKEVQRVCACRCEKVTQWCPWELSHRNIVRQFGVTLRRCIESQER